MTKSIRSQVRLCINKLARKRCKTKWPAGLQIESDEGECEVVDIEREIWEMFVLTSADVNFN